MEYVYLGLFRKVFEWVLNRIIDPVYRFVSGLLVTVFSWIFNEVLAPVLMPVLKDVLNFFIHLWLEIYSNHLYLLFSGILKIIDYLEMAFDIFIGLKDVTFIDPVTEVKVEGTLLEVLMQQNSISTVFWMITLGALGVALILTIYATAKSAFDLDFENKRPVSKVLTAMMKTFIQFFSVPFLVFFMLKLSAAILKGVTSAMNFGATTSLGRIVFMIASLNAAKDETLNAATLSDPEIVLGTSVADKARYPFYALEAGEGIEGITLKDYGNIEQVSDVFHLASFDYLIGFIAAIFLLLTIGMCLFVFVQRIFEVMLLYLVSPYFVCMIPLDDGEKFGRWREMFIGKCFSGFGSVVGMRLFLLICPIVMGGTINFWAGQDGASVSGEMNYLMKLFFLAGGAWAVYKSGSMITSLLSYQAGSSEAGTAAVAGGMLFGHTIGYAMSKGRQAIHSGISGGRARAGQAGAGPAGSGAGAAGGGRFTGSKGDGAQGVMKRPGIGKRFNNTLAAGSEAADHIRKLGDSVFGPNRGIKTAARQAVRSYDSIRNISRARAGLEKSSGLEMKIDKTVGAFRKGMSAMGASFDATEKSMRASKESVGRTFKTLAGPGSFADKMGSIGTTAKSIYGTSKQFVKIGENYEKMKVDIHKGMHHRENLGAFKLTLDSDNSVLAREFPGARFTGNPADDPEKLKINFESMGLTGSLESAGSSGGSEGYGGGSESYGGDDGSSSASGVPGSGSSASGVPGSKSSGSGVRIGGIAGTSGGLRGKTTPWTAGSVRPYQVRCTVPAVQKVTTTSAGMKVNYTSLSVRGVQFRGTPGIGQRTRRNSI